MPVQIGEVQSEVSVDAPRGGDAGAQQQPLPQAAELQRQRQLQQQLSWDEARYAACDQDD